MEHQISYMDEQTARALICDYGRRLYDKQYVAANDGNLSVRLGTNAVLCTPSGVSKGFLSPEMLLVLDMKGEVLSGSMKPTSEIKMHLRVYQEDPRATAVVHAHPKVATSFAVAGVPLDKPILSEAVAMLGPVPVAPYGTPGTDEVADSITPYCKDHSALLLANHGALTWGIDLTEAYFRMESLEHYATVYFYANYQIGQCNVLSEEQVNKLKTTADAIAKRNRNNAAD